MPNPALERVVGCFEARSGRRPETVVRAPGRVNLIGEHTDYNEGFVLPMAIDRAVWIALRPRGDARVQLYALDFDQREIFDLNELQPGGARWVEYVKGVAWALQDMGCALQGWEGVIVGEVPIGAGLSSSAALELATLRAFAAVSNLPWDPVQMAQVAQKAENEWVGVKSGIMDPMVCAVGKARHAVLLDCRSLKTQWVPMPRQAAVVVLDTSTRRGLLDSDYNERRSECERAVRCLNVAALRDISLEQFEARARLLDERIRRRARHVVSEDQRTLQAAEALKKSDLERFGKLMNESHRSLRDDFEVSSAALDQMVACAQQQPGCFGARMTGAGFGGCAVALVQWPFVPSFIHHIGARYRQISGLAPQLHTCQASQGAEVIKV